MRDPIMEGMKLYNMIATGKAQHRVKALEATVAELKDIAHAEQRRKDEALADRDGFAKLCQKLLKESANPASQKYLCDSSTAGAKARQAVVDREKIESLRRRAEARRIRN
ncbi:hypothetical protein [Undibacterium terreum]|uniref:Uncharacterized protein n=1 Tax=Undibacterium terreum TaxID=1224302 RepID=A0A916XPP8_9BURK|nr:hypothetical protein [Undibacterium terreum]GGC93630.1 hypothetical protein GCM10011396_46170 [Undibacterium terreum]